MSDGKKTLYIGKVSRSVVESSNGSTISLNGYHSQQCLEHNIGVYDIRQVTILSSRISIHLVRKFSILLLFALICSKCQ